MTTITLLDEAHQMLIQLQSEWEWKRDSKYRRLVKDWNDLTDLMTRIDHHLKDHHDH